MGPATMPTPNAIGGAPQPEMPSRRITATHFAILCGLAMTGVTMLMLGLDFRPWSSGWRLIPMEDAAMLLRYAVNLAQGDGISYNSGANPADSDGATDLGFVLILAPLLKAGVKPMVATILVNLVSVFLVGALIGLSSVLMPRVPRSAIASVVVLLAIGPVSLYVGSGFSPPLQAAVLAGTAVCVLAGMRDDVPVSRWRLVVLGSALAGTAGWIRPDGFAMGAIVIAGALLVAAVPSWSRFPRTCTSVGRNDLLAALAPFAVVGGLWAGFRIVYFGQLLPTAAINKAGQVLPHNVVAALQFYVTVLAPLVALVILASLTASWRILPFVGIAIVGSLCWLVASLPRVGLAPEAALWGSELAALSRHAGALTLALLMPVLAWAGLAALARRRSTLAPIAALALASLVWVGVGSTVDWWYRMEWPISAPLGILMLAALDESMLPSPRTRGASFASFVFVMGLLGMLPLLAFHSGGLLSILHPPGRSQPGFSAAIADALSSTETSGVRLATSEAGLIPLSTKGPALDILGLNDRELAQSGGSSLPGQLDQLSPNLVALHVATPPELGGAAECQPGPDAGRWTRAGNTTLEWARMHDLVPILATETSKCESWVVYAAPDLPTPVREALQRAEYAGTPLLRRSG